MNKMAYGRMVWLLAVWCVLHQVRGEDPAEENITSAFYPFQKIPLEAASQTLKQKYDNITNAFNWFQMKLQRPTVASPEGHTHSRLFGLMLGHLLNFAAGRSAPSATGSGPHLIFNRPWQELHLIRALVQPALVAVRKSCGAAASDSECAARVRGTDLALALRCPGYRRHARLRDTLKHLVADPHLRDIFYAMDAAANAKLTDSDVQTLMSRLVSMKNPALRSLKNLYHQVHPPNQFEVYPCVEMFRNT